MSAEWWNSSSAIAVCCELLRKLSEWLQRGYCPNYFIADANLYHEPSTYKLLEKTFRQLNKFRNSEILCNWFEEHYILPSIRRYCKITEPEKQFFDYMTPLLEFWKAKQLKSLEYYISDTYATAHARSRNLMQHCLNSGLRLRFNMSYASGNFQSMLNTRLSDLPEIQNVSCLKYHDIVLYILHVAYGVGCGEISWDSGLFVEFINAIVMQPKIIRSQYHNFPETDPEIRSRFQFLRAQSLMESLTGLNSRSECELLSLMSKEFLREALKYNDSQTKGCASAALTYMYLAALCFATSEYQQALRFCSEIFVDNTSLENNEPLNAGCLLFIDDVARIIGLSILQKKITQSNLHYINKRLYLDLRLSPEVFANYLTALVSGRINSCSDLPNNWPHSVRPMDENVKALIKSKFNVPKSSVEYDKALCQMLMLYDTEPYNSQPTHFNITRTDLLDEATVVNPVKETVIHFMMEYALENMTSFYNAIRQDFGISCNTNECYRALYLYKCRHYTIKFFIYVNEF